MVEVSYMIISASSTIDGGGVNRSFHYLHCLAIYSLKRILNFFQYTWLCSLLYILINVLACVSRNMFIREKNVRFYIGHMGIWLYLNFPFQSLLL